MQSIIFSLSLTAALGAYFPASALAEESCVTNVETPIERFASADVVREKLTGVWLFCGNDGSDHAFSPTSHSGIEITADGRAYLLSDDGQGHFLRLMGFDHEYEARVQDYPFFTGDSYFYWRVAGDTGLNVVAPHFTQNGDHVRFTRDEASSVYQRSQKSVVVPPVLDQGMRKGAQGCTQPEAVVRKMVRSADELRDLIHGNWWDCKIETDGSIFPLFPDYVFGVHFTKNGQWHYIISADGTISTKPKDMGIFRINKRNEEYQIILEQADGGYLSLIGSFSEAPVKAHLIGVAIKSDGASWSIVNGLLSGLPAL